MGKSMSADCPPQTMTATKLFFINRAIQIAFMEFCNTCQLSKQQVGQAEEFGQYRHCHLHLSPSLA